MTFTEKLLLRFCSTEVQTMLQRLRERPEDFDYHKKLYDIIRHKEHYTRVEQRCIDAAWTHHEKNEGRRALLTAIMSELINPKKRYE
jgi:hypothetical protein